MSNYQPYVESQRVKDIRQFLQVFLALTGVILIGWCVEFFVNKTPYKWPIGFDYKVTKSK